MKNSTQKSIRNLSVAILVIGGLALVYSFVQMVALFGSSQYFTPVNWNPDIKGWQVFILTARFVSIVLLFVLCCIFLHRTNKGLDDGDIFPESNIKIIRWTALVIALLAFVNNNYSAALKGESVLTLDYNVIIFPLVVLLFAGLYKMAYLAAKDSQLAI